MPHKIDYRSVDLPDDEQYREWTYAQRRAYILSEMRDVGHPQLMRQTELGEKFGVDQSTISRDIDALGEYVDETLGDRRQLTTGSVVQRCITELLEDGEWKDAGNLALKYDEWLAREADLSEMQEQLQAILSADGAPSAGGDGDGSGESESNDGGDGGPPVELTFEG